MNLNELYKAINTALDIPRPERPAIMEKHGGSATNATMAGYWRKPDDSRYRRVTPPTLLMYCQGIMALCPPDNPVHLAALEKIIDTFERKAWLGEDIMAAFTDD